MQPSASLVKSQQAQDTRGRGKSGSKGKQKTSQELARQAQQAEAMAAEARLNREHAKVAMKAKEEAKKSAAASASQGFSGNADDFLFFADTCFMQGRADAHMDRHVVVKDLAAAGKVLKMPLDRLDKPQALFAIYDGHLGPQCSEYCAQNFHKKLLPRLTKVSLQREQTVEEQIRASLRTSLAELDSDYCGKFRTDRSGCCTQIGLLVGRRLYIAGLGGTRSAIFAEGDAADTCWDSEVLTGTHLASIPEEHERIKSSGGAIIEVAPGVLHVASQDFEKQMREFRIQQSSGMGCGCLPPTSSPFTRSLGDRALKIPKAIIEPVPEIRTILLQKSHRGFALFCDGIADVMTDAKIGWVLQYNVGSEKKAASEIVQEAYKRGSEQNLTVLAVYLRWPNKRTHDVTFAQSPVEEAQRRKALKRQQQAIATERLEPVTSAPASPSICLPTSLASQQARHDREAAPKSKVNGAIAETELHHTAEAYKSMQQEIRLRFLAYAGPLYKDSDGDVAHEFLEEAKFTNGKGGWLLKISDGVAAAFHSEN